MSGYLLVLAHALALATLIVGGRAWLRSGRARPRAIEVPRSPTSEARYREVVADLAELTKRREAGQVDGATFEARRRELLDAAMRLKGE